MAADDRSASATRPGDMFLKPGSDQGGGVAGKTFTYVTLLLNKKCTI